MSINPILVQPNPLNDIVLHARVEFANFSMSRLTWSCDLVDLSSSTVVTGLSLRIPAGTLNQGSTYTCFFILLSNSGSSAVSTKFTTASVPPSVLWTVRPSAGFELATIFTIQTDFVQNPNN